MRGMTPLAAAAALVLSALTLFHGCAGSAHSTKAACIPARIGGRTACLRPGVRCKPQYQRVYRSYGLTCKGSELRQRNYVGPGNP